MISISTLITILPLLSGTVFAANDWSVPCFNGTCSYDSAVGTLQIWGSADAITDITTAAGWTILNCDKDALTQDIRLVCSGDDNGCSHLWQNTGAVNKLVRLPQNCGANAFARISRNWVHEDQSLPPGLAKALRRRAGSDIPVQGLALDTNFSDIDPATNGNVGLAIQGANIPGANGNATIVDPATAPARRGLFSIVEDAFKKFTSFDKSITKELPPVDVDKTFPIFDEKLSCPANGEIPAIDASLKADAVTKAHAVVSIGAAASGSIVPPKLDEFGVFVGLDASLTGTLELVGNAKATVDSGRITLFEVGIPGLDFPGILSVGPSFKILGQAKASMDVEADMKVNIAYNVKDAKLFFPSSQEQKSGGAFDPADSPLQLSVSPSVASKATVEGHVIPSLQLGISALGGAAAANVFLDLDASAAVTLSLDASDTISKNITTRAVDVQGCVDVGTQLDVNAGADASFFKLFDKNTKVNLFTKKFDLFKKCLGTAADKKSRSIRRSDHVRVYRRSRSGFLLNKRDITCPTSLLGDAVSIADETVAAADIKAE